MVLARRIAGHNIYWTCRLKLVLSPLPDISEFLWAPTWATTNDNQRPSKQTRDRIASFIPSQVRNGNGEMVCSANRVTLSVRTQHF